MAEDAFARFRRLHFASAVPSPEVLEAFEERAAIMEYDGGLCREDAERLAWECVADGEQRQSEVCVLQEV